MYALSPTGSCRDNGCSSQWENHGACVDFSNNVDFVHLEAMFNLSAGSKQGLCANNYNEKKECCHCLNSRVTWIGDCTEFSESLSSQMHLTISPTNSLEECITLCQSRDHRYAGLQNGSSCWCGDEEPQRDDIRPGECDTHCPGNDHQICGAETKINVYDTDCKECIPTAMTKA